MVAPIVAKVPNTFDFLIDHYLLSLLEPGVRDE